LPGEHDFKIITITCTFGLDGQIYSQHQPGGQEHTAGAEMDREYSLHNACPIFIIDNITATGPTII